MSQTTSTLASDIWAVADLLRGDFKQSQYGRIILPLTLLRRLECVLEPTKTAVVEAFEKLKQIPEYLLDTKLIKPGSNCSQTSTRTSSCSVRTLAELGGTTCSNLRALIKQIAD